MGTEHLIFPVEPCHRALRPSAWRPRNRGRAVSPSGSCCS